MIQYDCNTISIQKGISFQPDRDWKDIARSQVEEGKLTKLDIPDGVVTDPNGKYKHSFTIYNHYYLRT